MSSLWKIVSWVMGALVAAASGGFYVGEFVKTVNDHTRQLNHIENKVDRIMLHFGLPTEDPKDEKDRKGDGSEKRR